MFKKNSRWSNGTVFGRKAKPRIRKILEERSLSVVDLRSKSRHHPHPLYSILAPDGSGGLPYPLSSLKKGNQFKVRSSIHNVTRFALITLGETNYRGRRIVTVPGLGIWRFFGSVDSLPEMDLCY